MITQKRIFSFLIFLLVVSFTLVGCEIPFSSQDGAEAIPTADPNSGGGVQPAEEGSVEEPVPETQPEAETATESTESEVTEESLTATEIEKDTTESEEESTEIDSEVETSTETVTETEELDEDKDSSAEVEVSTTDTSETNNTPSNTSPVPPTTSTGACPVTHTVQAGENLYRIGLQYGMSWVPIANANGLANPNAIYVGQVLVIPVQGCAPIPPQPVPPIEGTTYVVQYGDTLYSIGLKFGVSWVQIAEANGIVNPNQIYAGQVLKIPVAQPGPTPNFTHRVQYGETLYSISIHYGVPWQAIAAANQIPPPYIVYAGQTIIIPGSW